MRCGVSRSLTTDAAAFLLEVEAGPSVRPGIARNPVHTASFSRYFQPHSSPLAEPEWPAPLQALANALERHDEDTCWKLVQQYRGEWEARDTFPYTLWQSLWLLVAEGPSPLPVVGQYARLDRVCKRLHTLQAFHESLYPRRTLSASMQQRYVYLLLKRAERLGLACDAAHDPALQTALKEEQRSQAIQILTALLHSHSVSHAALDTPLLGRAVFRLAHLGAVRALLLLLNAYAARKDHSTQPGAAVQPFSAIIQACMYDTHHDIGIEALRLAFALRLNMKSTLVQKFLSSLGADQIHTLYAACTNAACSEGPMHLDVHASRLTLLTRLAATRPAYFAHRCAVVLCRHDDPSVALRTLRDDPNAPFDVYGAVITALSWRTRKRAKGAAQALMMAVQTLESLQAHENSEYDTDEQMYGELIRAFAHAPRHAAKDAIPAELAQFAPPLSAYDWEALLGTFTAHVLARMLAQDVHTLRFAHHALLLSMNLEMRNYMHAKRLYEQIRTHFPSTVPIPERTEPHFLWLFGQACKNQTQVSFAVRLYHDWSAFGRKFSPRSTASLLRALVDEKRHAAAQHILSDIYAYDAEARAVYAPAILRVYMNAGLPEQAFEIAHRLYAQDCVWPQFYEHAQFEPPPLRMYAVCIYEASRSRLMASETARAKLLTWFDEFRLALAHTMAQPDAEQDMEAACTKAYLGVVQMHLYTLGMGTGSGADVPAVPAHAAALASADATLDELQDLQGSGNTIPHELNKVRKLVARAREKYEKARDVCKEY
ncbi:hypothetical protein MVES1_001070 [Malassezia vespertilionis]|uniref:Uncharacterized protein n=1 Tax=Malassezia vespertilionis TaxID=2020962 RepID=A0A2N1JEN2_9BASI|nr:uncharacterized protein MVES1_001070 [Malassezia vespertilionis]PKI85004.1 hypothetical protein MVES_001010 [Malassezia vespertilionis]WFD05737.1 hypothetical protein MVES1_001070 [Malassezia vespertilionis]